ncbi:MAG: hypothetical protein PHW65_05925 [Dehalococcoidales bacterium]|nr:hypothetical protein [Dehalococcoidales bacterium]
MNESKELIVAEELNVEQVYTAGGLDPILERIKSQVDGFTPNIDTATGRKEVASLAHKVARSKVLLDDLGKNLVSGWKQKAKVVDNERKRMRDFLDNLKDEVRQPLTEWENTEKERIARLEWIIDETKSAGESTLANYLQFPLEAMVARLKEIKTIAIDESFAEYSSAMAQTKDKAISQMEQAIAQREKHDAEQAELARLRQEAAEREAKEREERIRQEAADKARKEAEEKARIEAERIEREKQEAIRRQVEAERREKEAAERAERDRIAAEERAKIEKEMAVREAERRAEQKEAERLAKERAEKEEADRKAANKKHRAKVEEEAVESLIKLEWTEEAARTAIDIIKNGLVRNVTINY